MNQIPFKCSSIEEGYNLAIQWLKEFNTNLSYTKKIRYWNLEFNSNHLLLKFKTP